jgi:hypothetical protein
MRRYEAIGVHEGAEGTSRHQQTQTYNTVVYSAHQQSSYIWTRRPLLSRRWWCRGTTMRPIMLHCTTTRHTSSPAVPRFQAQLSGSRRSRAACQAGDSASLACLCASRPPVLLLCLPLAHERLSCHHRAAWDGTTRSSTIVILHTAPRGCEWRTAT